MISVPLIDELRETRRRLADDCGGDLDRYAEMLRQVSQRIPGQYIRSPLTPEDQRAGREQPPPPSTARGLRSASG
ncbi:MAG: hypothetical protein O3C40_06990 [Planctomycetota bacterium]|nr:hypothetical protein [Planctomycetota bacterium]